VAPLAWPTSIFPPTNLSASIFSPTKVMAEPTRSNVPLEQRPKRTITEILHDAQYGFTMGHAPTPSFPHYLRATLPYRATHYGVLLYLRVSHSPTVPLERFTHPFTLRRRHFTLSISITKKSCGVSDRGFIILRSQDEVITSGAG
jgi:hypothetical protein